MNLRDYERESIRRFVLSAAAAGYLSGRVLDYGCGAQPYRGIVEAARGEYHPYDRLSFPASVAAADYGFSNVLDEGDWTAILCTQVVQYLPLLRYGKPPEQTLQGLLRRMQLALTLTGGVLVMTYVTNWPWVEQEDLHRFTRTGMERLLNEAGFVIERHVERGSVHDPQFHTAVGKRVRATGEEFVLGYGVVARA